MRRPVCPSALFVARITQTNVSSSAPVSGEGIHNSRKLACEPYRIYQCHKRNGEKKYLCTPPTPSALTPTNITDGDANSNTIVCGPATTTRPNVNHHNHHHTTTTTTNPIIATNSSNDNVSVNSKNQNWQEKAAQSFYDLWARATSSLRRQRLETITATTPPPPPTITTKTYQKTTLHSHLGYGRNICPLLQKIPNDRGISPHATPHQWRTVGSSSRL